MKKELEIGTESYRCYKVVAALHLMKAEYFLSVRQSAWNEIRLGIEAADRSIHYNPKMAEVYGTRGNLYLLQARLQRGDTRLKDAREAVASFDRAFQLNSTLRGEFAGKSEEAKRLAQN